MERVEVRAKGKHLLVNKQAIRVIVDIKPGPTTPAQKQVWKRFWQKLISEGKGDEREGRQKD